MIQRRYRKYESLLPGLREACSSYLGTLPIPVLALLEAVPFEDLIGTRKYLGEYFAFWLAETLSITDYEHTLQAGVASFLGRSYVVIQDLLIDDPGHQDRNLLFTCGLFLASSLEAYIGLVPRPDVFMSHVNDLLRTFVAANITEQSHYRNQGSSYDEKTIRALGDKTCIAASTVVALALLAGRDDAIEPLSQTIRRSVIGLQICEDILDWEEDLQRGNYTLPIVLSIESLRRRAPHVPLRPVDEAAPQRDAIRAALFDFDTMQRLMAEVSTHFRLAGLDAARIAKQTSILEHLTEAVHRNDLVLSRLHSLSSTTDSQDAYSLRAEQVIRASLKRNFGRS